MKIRNVLLAAVAATAMSGAALAQDPGWYISAAGGGNWAEFENNDASIFTIDDYDTGYAVVGAAGYKWTNNVRVELEGSGRWEEGSYSFFGVIPVETDTYGAVMNVIYDFGLGENTTLSVGGGVGIGYVNWDEPGANDSDFGLAYQLLAELAIGIGEQTDLFVGYRYFNVDNVKLFGDDYDYEAHTALLGLRYYFSAAAAPVVVDDTPPPAACAQQTFLVFFDFNKANLTADAAGVVAEAATAYKAGCSVVLVVGHTDTVGSMSYNQDLSERRAASVKAEMVNQGVPADAISTEGKSFTDPLVPTGPGVKEAQNRRAVISVQ